MRLLESLIYPFKQHDWPQKLLLAIIFAAIPFLGFFIIKGWEFEISVRVRRGDSDLLPYWDGILNKLWRGIRLRLSGFLFNTPTWFFLILGLVLWLRVIGSYLIDPDEVKNWARFFELLRQDWPLRVGLLIMALLSAVGANLMYWSGYLRYIETRDWWSFFDLWTNFTLAFKNIWDDLLMGLFLSVLGFVVGLVDGALISLLSATGIGAFLAPIFVPAFTFTILTLTSGHLFGQLAVRTLGPTPAARAA